MDGRPAGTGHYLVLRSEAGVTTGRAFDNIEGTLTWIDPQPPAPGTQVSYLVHAMSFNPNSVSLAHTDRLSVTCC